MLYLNFLYICVFKSVLAYLTLTNVVFEFVNIQVVSLIIKHLTLTNVVFEFFYFNKSIT